MKERPLGVTILAVLAILAGVWSLCGGIFGITTFSLGALTSLIGIGGGTGGLFGGLYGIVWGTVSILLGLGLWRMYAWARLGTLIVQVINIVYAVIAFIAPPKVNWIGLILSIIIVLYMTRPRIKALFE